MNISFDKKHYPDILQAIKEMEDVIIILTTHKDDRTTMKIRTMASKHAIRERLYNLFQRTIQTDVSL
jgi:hypothetical protein